MKTVTAKETCATATKLVLPNDTNTLHNLFGGQLMAWMDEIASISASRQCRRVVVTAAVNSVSFDHPIKLGDFVTLEAKVSRAFTSSMEVIVDVLVENQVTGKKKRANQAIFIFVAIDQMGRPIEIPQVVAETKEEEERYDAALRRKQLSLILAGKMKPKDASELKALFE